MEIKFLTKEEIEEYLPFIAELYEQSFNRSISLSTLKWRYIDNPIDEILFVICKDKGRIISSYSASPCLMMKDQEVYKTAISLNTMTHPDYQGRGLFVELANKLYEYMKEKDYKLIWGFPNNISHRIFIDRLNWKTIYEVPTMTLNLDKVNKVKSINLDSDDNFELDYCDLEKNNIKDIYIIKNKSYLKWRYSNNPQNKYINLVIKRNNKVAGYIVIKEYNDIINIIDINYTNLEDAENMVNSIIKYAQDIDKTKVTVWASINTNFHSSLEKIGFYNDYPIRYLGGKTLDDSKGGEGFVDYKNWLIHAGDNNEY